MGRPLGPATVGGLSVNSTRKTTYGYSRRHRAVEILCIATVGVLLAGFAIKVSRTIQTPADG